MHYDLLLCQMVIIYFLQHHLSCYVHCYRITIHDNLDLAIPTSATFQLMTLPHWENLFANNASVSSMDMSTSETALVVGSEDGDLV